MGRKGWFIQERYQTIQGCQGRAFQRKLAHAGLLTHLNGCELGFSLWHQHGSNKDGIGPGEGGHSRRMHN